jgi:hypothetical protein
VGQYEQDHTARYLAARHVGAWSRRFAASAIPSSRERAHALGRAFGEHGPPTNDMLFGCLDEILERVQSGEKRPAVLEAPAMGKWEG